jgi:hypothetical protein
MFQDDFWVLGENIFKGLKCNSVITEYGIFTISKTRSGVKIGIYIQLLTIQ